MVEFLGFRERTVNFLACRVICGLYFLDKKDPIEWRNRSLFYLYPLILTVLVPNSISIIGDPEWPEPKHGMEWTPTCQAMRSAYAVAGEEPDFTNFARIKEEDPFIDTLDYIFLSEEWKVKGVKELCHRTDSGGPFPNLDRGEPSDHVLIAADLEL